ncbi:MULTISPECIES: RNA polymerase sigma factor [unclassified Sphingomonas]|uniref:RNA polymerase sigma factor n=1 Tax=unclassified Sphingomonas TaxID=196159 RepID=UPI000835825A|nr:MULTISPECIES: RNA polymerase sigma factor [unclassified Sphingomonas]MBX3595241.1 RNA polymerase sigma factor [Sphingomonas sp.]
MTFDLASLSDGELAALSLVGRSAAFAELLKRHRDAIYRIVAGSIGDPDEALDLVQETFIAAHGALRRYDPARSMRAWLTAIAMNKCRDWARRRAVRKLIAFALPIDNIAERVAEDRPGHDVELADRDALARTSKAIASLPASLREVILLRTIEGLSQAETAATLRISEKAVETRLRRARIKLSQELEA